MVSNVGLPVGEFKVGTIVNMQTILILKITFIFEIRHNSHSACTSRIYLQQFGDKKADFCFSQDCFKIFPFNFPFNHRNHIKVTYLYLKYCFLFY